MGAVLAVAEWNPNVGNAASDAMVAGFHQCLSDPRDDRLRARTQAMAKLLMQAMAQVRSADSSEAARWRTAEVCHQARLYSMSFAL